MDQSDVYKRNLSVLKKTHPHIHELLKEKEYPYPYPYQRILNDKSEVNVSVGVGGDSGLLYYDDDGKGIMVGAVETLSSQILKKNDLLMCVGMGLAYIPLAAIGTYPDKPKIVIMEPCVEAFVLAVSLVDLTELLGYEHLDIHLGREISIPQTIKKYADDFYIGTCRRITHLPSRQVFGERFVSFEKKIDDTLNQLFIGWNTVRSHGEKLHENGIFNLASLFDGITIDRLKDHFRDMPAVVVASGPSLENDLQTIKQIRDNALILSCDSAVRPLIRENVIPHMFFAVDYKNINFDKVRFNLEELRDSIFVYWMEASMDNVRGFLGDKRVGVMSGNVFNNAFIQSIFNYNFTLPGAVSSNSDLAILTAIQLGCNPIILAGMDLAFSEGKDHAAGSVLRNHDNKNKMIMIDGLDGNPVYSLMPMVAGRVVLENNIQRHNRQFIDASLNGAYITGTVIKSLREVKESILKEKFDFDRIIGQIDWTPAVSMEKAEEPFKQLTAISGRLEKDAKKNLVDVCILKNARKKLTKEQLTNKTKHSMVTFSRFKTRHRIGLVMVEKYRFTDQLDVDRSIANLGMDNDLTADTLNFKVLEIQRKYYRSIYLAARKAHRQSNEKNNYFHEINDIKRGFSRNDDKAEDYLLLARRHAREGMVWLSEKAYQMYLKIHPGDVTAISELADLYMGMRMWKQAELLVKNAEPDCTHKSHLDPLKSKIRKCISEILGSAQAKINAKNIDKKLLNEARREILEVQLVLPENVEAAVLFEKLKEMEKQQQIKINTAIGSSYSQEQCSHLEEKAKRFINQGEYEKAVGIYEGFIKHFPEKENVFRRRIGDLRFETGDYKSALWHYHRGIKHSTDDEKLIYRVRFASPLAEAESPATKDDKVSATVVVVSNGALEGLSAKINQIDNALPGLAEIILLLQSENDRSLNSEVTQSIEKSLKSKLTVLEMGPKSVMSVNSAFINAKGKTIVLVDTGNGSGYPCMGALIKRIGKKQAPGLFGPWVLDGETDENGKTRTSGRDLFFAFSREVLRKVGLLDVSFSSLADACEDLRIRADMEGLDSRVFTDIRMFRPDGNRYKKQTHDLGEKWSKGHLPEFYEKKYNIYRLCGYAKNLFAKDEADTAINTLVEGIKNYPECNIFYRFIAQMLIGEKRYAEAVQVLGAIPENNGNPVDADLNFHDIWDNKALSAYAMFYSGDITAALDMARTVPAASAENAKMQNLLGMAAFAQEDYNSAKKHLELSIRSDHDFGLPWFYLGEIKQIQGDVVRAFKLKKKAFLTAPEDTDIANGYYQYGCLEEFMNEVISHFEKVIQWYPENKKLHYLLADLLIQTKNFERAMALIEKCIITFGKEDGIVDAALNIREQLGPDVQKGKDRDNAAVVKIDSEIDNFESFLYHLKSDAGRIDFVDNGKSPNARNIATAFGAFIVPDNRTQADSYKWDFKHNDVLNWLCERKVGKPNHQNCCFENRA